ncbi:hypothetical protein KKE92_03345 [Candidatus Micrarchaeota archaeon]|nr:hypothetical protein [Candidatus Micrarchaeota archaeon]MBU1681665.1 hypothetical protein [Candidatus Micrarchaeota archaeon]
MRVLAILSLIVLFVSGCTIPSYSHVCPDGEVVSQESECLEYSPKRIEADPNEYEKVFLENNQSSYVKINGEIKTDIEINEGEDVWTMYGYLHPYEPERHRYVKIINSSGNVYTVNLSAPAIPSSFYFGATKRVGQTPEKRLFSYELTVIGEVENETMAQNIADSFMKSKIEKTINNWRSTSKQVGNMSDTWDVYLETKYTWCPPVSMGTTIFDLDNCVDNTVTGHYIIDKKTGQIIG